MMDQDAFYRGVGAVLITKIAAGAPEVIIPTGMPNPTPSPSTNDWGRFLPSNVTKGMNTARDAMQAMERLFDNINTAKGYLEKAKAFPGQAKGWLNTNIAAPFIGGVSDTTFGGLVRYDPSTSGLQPNIDVAKQRVWGEDVTANNAPGPDSSRWARMAYNAGKEPSISKPAVGLFGGMDKIKSQLEEGSEGLFSLGDKQNDVQVNRMTYGMYKAKDWLTNPDNRFKIMAGIGGISALGLGLSALNNSGKRRSSPPVASPGQALPPPFAGREGNVFTPD